MVTPGYTVDSKIIISLCFKIFESFSQTSFKCPKSGFLFLWIGVGTVTINKFEFIADFIEFVNLMFLFVRFFFLTSLNISFPLLKSICVISF